MAKKFPEIKEKNEGKFTAWVEKNMGGMDTCKAASKIMRSRTKKYSPAVVKMANYANNFGCKNKKDDGASVPLKGKQKNLPDALKSKILASDGASMKKPPSKKRNKKLIDQKGYIKQSNSGRGTKYDQKKEGETLKGGRKHKFYKDGKKVAVAKDRVAGFGKNKRRTGVTIDIKK